jgi:N-acetyl-alpha-D-glucosaminyl L-malate synthase BshA
VPHATAAILARDMLPLGKKPCVVTTLHGTDTTLLGRDPGYGPAIAHALASSDAVTTVSKFLLRETQELMSVTRPIEVIYNFFEPRAAKRSRAAVRRELGIGRCAMLLHASNLRQPKRIDLLLETVARIRPQTAFKLVVLAGASWAPFEKDVKRLGLQDRVVVRERVTDIEDYLQAADIGLFTSEVESFCVSILEQMNFGCPSVSTDVGGIPEVTLSGKTGLLVPFGDADALARAVESLLKHPAQRRALGAAAKVRARKLFSADAIVPRYEALYRRVCAAR